jgi:adenylate cyclase class 2
MAASIRMSMLEIEVKCPVEDLDAVERRLKELSAAFDQELKQSDLYLSHPCRDFGRTDEALRLRRENERSILFYKGPKVDKATKTREEISTPVPDPASLRLILEKVGFRKVMEVEKVRRVYRLHGVEVSLDRVTGLGGFIELEVQDLELETGKRMLESVMKELGLERTERSSYLELLLKKNSSDAL